MPKKLGTVFILSALTLAFAAAALAATAPSPSTRSFTYLGVLAKDYPQGMVTRELRHAGVTVAGIEQGMLLFQLTDHTRATRWLRNFAFLRSVYTDAAAVSKDPAVRELPLAKDFLRLSRGTASRSARTPRLLDASGNPAIVPGPTGVTATMLSLDAKLRRLGTAARTTDRVLDGVPDDAYEDNDTIDTAATVTAGTYNDLQRQDADWYKIDVPEGSDLVIRIDFTNSAGNLDIELYGPSQEWIMESYTTRDWERVLLPTAPAGYYYVRVDGNNNSYSMTVELTSLGEITGTVTRHGSSDPVGDCLIKAYDLDGYYINETISDTGSGAFVLPEDTGSYVLWLSDVAAGNYLGEYYNDAATADEADAVDVTRGLVTSGINAGLAQGGQISGHLYGESPGEISQFFLELHDLSGSVVLSGVHNSPYVMHCVPPGTYKLKATPRVGNFIAEWYQDKATFATADDFEILAGMDLVNIDFAFAAGGLISGHVIDGGGAPLDGATVEAYDASGSLLRSGTTDPVGDYTIEGLPTGSHLLRFHATAGFIDEWYNDQPSMYTATPVAVTANQTTSGIDAQLEYGGRIIGSVSNGTDFIKDVCVRVFDLEMNQVTAAWTIASGSFTTDYIRPGTYKVLYDASSTGYASEWFDDKRLFAEADPVTVVSNQNVAAGAILDPGGSLSVKVRNRLGNGLLNAGVSLYDSAQNLLWAASTGSGGLANFEGLPAGNYKMFVDATYVYGTYISEWYNDKATFATADNVTITGGATTSIGVILSNRATISVTAPAAGVKWFTGTTHNVTWVKAGAQSATVKIQLYKGSTMQGGGTLAGTITSSTANTGSRAWTIPATMADGNAYRIKVSTTDGKVVGWSGIFSIAKPSINIDEPQAGTVWTRGASPMIMWYCLGTNCSWVKIQLMKGTTIIKTIAAAAPNSGDYSWTIPTTLGAASTYRIVITTTDGKAKGKSAAFTIQ